MKKYLIRLDDACPTMNLDNWLRIEKILDETNVHPMVGIIPANRDPEQQINVIDPNFWNRVKKWEEKGWSIAMHGYDHYFISDKGLSGLNPLWRRSEFAGLSLEKQKEKIRNGVSIFRENGIEPKYFFAPAHTFDENTLNALREKSNIRIISDTIATKPYRMKDFVFIPQVGGHCKDIKLPGIWTFCLHPSIMSDKDFIMTEKFLKSHKHEMISFDNINVSTIKEKDLISKSLSWIYFTRRRIKGIK